jgi:hypothetical protein
MLFVRAADEGRSAVERFPTAKVIGDIDNLADRLMETTESGSNSRKSGYSSRNRFADSFRGLFGRITTQVS